MEGSCSVKSKDTARHWRRRGYGPFLELQQTGDPRQLAATACRGVGIPASGRRGGAWYAPLGVEAREWPLLEMQAGGKRRQVALSCGSNGVRPLLVGRSELVLA